jgi:hypothetical protein
MGILDKVKGLLSGNKAKVKQGVESGAEQVKKVVPDQHDAKVDQAADAVEQAIDKLAD